MLLFLAVSALFVAMLFVVVLRLVVVALLVEPPRLAGLSVLSVRLKLCQESAAAVPVLCCRERRRQGWCIGQAHSATGTVNRPGSAQARQRLPFVWARRW